MHERILRRFRDRIRAKEYVMTVHAEEEMTDDGFSILDVEHGILAGQIIERQRDFRTREWKYLGEGPSLSGGSVVVVAKLGQTNKLVMITVYRTQP